MMKETLEILVAFVGGIIVGVVAGAGIANRIAGRKHEEQMQTQAKENVDISAELQDKNYENEQLKQKVDDLESSYERIGQLAEKDKDFAEHISERVGPEDDPPFRPPFVISMEDFQLRYYRSEDHSLTYYQPDGILVDECGNLVENPVVLVGEDGQWALENTEDDTIYIHCDEMNANYEIDVRQDSYVFANLEDDDLEE